MKKEEIKDPIEAKLVGERDAWAVKHGRPISSQRLPEEGRSGTEVIVKRKALGK